MDRGDLRKQEIAEEEILRQPHPAKLLQTLHRIRSAHACLPNEKACSEEQAIFDRMGLPPDLTGSGAQHATRGLDDIGDDLAGQRLEVLVRQDRKSTRLNSSH